MKFLKTALALLMLGGALYAAPSVVNGNEDLRKLPSNYDMIVAFYGRPGSKALGILGHYPLERVFDEVKTYAQKYEKALNGTHHVTPGLEIIYEMATVSPGAKGDHVLTLPEKRVLAYIEAAKRNHAVVILDVQLGKKSPAESIKPLLKYLHYDNVHLAIDPEFYVGNLSVRPGRKIGSISGEQINEAQKLMSDYLKAQNIVEDKILVVHSFTEHMVTHKKAVRYHDKIHLILNLDGHGSPALKVKIYNGLYTENRAAKISGGFKLFFRQDHPMMTPRQVLGLEPVSNNRVKDMPKFINYQ
jgi:hypothetical protein